MDLIIVGSGVDYGVNGSDAAITDIANVATLKEGSMLGSFENGTVILDTGAAQGGGLAGTKSYIHYNQGGVARSAAIDVATAVVVEPLSGGNDAAVVQVQTFSALLGTLSAGKYTGVKIYDNSKDIYDKTRETNADLYVDVNTTKTTYYAAIAVEIAKHPKVATCTNSSGTLTITMVAGANLGFVGLGYNVGVSGVVTTALSYGTVVSVAELADLVSRVEPHDGNFSRHIDGAPAMWSKEYGIDAASYTVYAIEHSNTPGYTSNDGDKSPNVVYIAVPVGQFTDGVSEVYIDVINAIAGTIGDTAADA